MESEVYIESITENGNPLFITVKINFYKDETAETSRASRPFWAYEILKIKACFKSRGETHDFSEDYLDSEHWSEINKECEKELQSFIRSAA